ncbi:MAG: histidine--tRNA ligase [Planctomycetes bacterium]|nr:histidine--tRNA ligase [Planctomycetota bacterium]
MKDKAYSTPRGTADILPDEIPYWRFVEETARAVFERYGYKEIRTPIFEETRLFNRSIGNATDIVSKEMYNVSATGSDENESFSLRPEFTASVVRSYIEHSMEKTQAFRKLYSIGPAFRHERPQKGRLRQFHQLNVEAIGSTDPALDAEIIQMNAQLFGELGLNKHEVRLNSLGCAKCRVIYTSMLRKHLEPAKQGLCPNCRTRFDVNILRVFDCKNPKCREIIKGFSVSENMCDECKTRFKTVQSYLNASNVQYRLDSALVRGLDYYTGTVYEITYPTLGAQDALGGGGRYDNLISSLGGQNLGAMGCALGIERIIIALKSENTVPSDKNIKLPDLTAFIALADASLKETALKLLADLRKAKISADTDYESRSLNSQMRMASKLNVKYVIFIGTSKSADLANVKEMHTGKETQVKLTDLTGYFK